MKLHPAIPLKWLPIEWLCWEQKITLDEKSKNKILCTFLWNPIEFIFSNGFAEESFNIVKNLMLSNVILCCAKNGENRLPKNELHADPESAKALYPA
ncbi:MAG TPA: hypothetical protein VFM18_01250 [Methanosarcina sp.]|nr:hypothetical protein [Methanosarcina sp.]